MDTRLNEPSYKLHYKRGGITNLKAIFGTWCKPTVYTPRRIAPAGINSGISRRHKDADPRWQVNIAIIPVYGRGRAWKLLMRPSGARHPCQHLALNPPCPRKFKRRAFDIVFPRDDPWSCRERACLSDLRNFAHWIAIVSISLRIVSSGTNREEIIIMKRDRIDSRREWDEREREVNESMAWKTWLYLATPWKRRITLRRRVPLCLETTRPAYSWEYLLLRGLRGNDRWHAVIVGSLLLHADSWNEGFDRYYIDFIRTTSNDGWIGDLVDI